MKKIIIAAAVVAGAFGANAQGLVNFNNSVSAATHISVNSTPGGAATGQTPAVANNFYYELFASATSSTVGGSSGSIIPPASGVGGPYVTGASGWIDTGLSAVNTASLGKVAGPTAGAFPTASSWAGGQTVNIVVIGWSANIGTTIGALEAFLANPTQLSGTTYIGESAVGSIKLGDGSSIPTSAVLSGTTVPGFTLGVTSVPEPTSIALGVMGGLSLLALRRKKA